MISCAVTLQHFVIDQYRNVQMGSRACCQPECTGTQLETKPEELRLSQQHNHPRGTVNRESIRYLTAQDLDLYKICSSGNHVYFSLFASDSLDFKVLDTNRTSLLHVAARSGHLLIAQMLVQRGCDLNLGDVNGCTPMHIAAIYRREDMVTLLMNLGGNPYTKNRQGKTVYESLTNQDLKALMTDGICDQKGVSQMIKDKDFCLMRNLYDQKSKQSQSGLQKSPIKSRLQNADQIMRTRASMLILYPTRLGVKKLSGVYFEACPTVFNILTNNKPSDGLAYLMSSDSLPVQFLMENLELLGPNIFDCLTTIRVRRVWEIGIKLISTLLGRPSSLAKAITTMIRHIPMRMNLPQVHVLCQMFARSKSHSIRDLGQLDSLVNFLFCAIVHNPRHKQHLVTPLVQSYIEEYAQQLNLTSGETSQILDLIEVVKQAPLQPKHEGSEATILGESGWFHETPKGFVFVGKDRAIVLQEKQNSLYEAIEVTDTEVTLLPQMYRLNR